MTNQEAFDKIVARLMDGTGRALDEGGECMYRAPNGLSCAVGCLIPDEEYYPRIEGLLADELINLNCLNKLNLYMLERLQFVHDEELNWTGSTLNEEGIRILQEIAAYYDLTMPEINNA